MKKPTPPDQERVELIISGDDPESYRAAQETARILAAPQIARTIQKRIEEYRGKINSVITVIVVCQSFAKQASYYPKNTIDNSVLGRVLASTFASKNQIVYVAPDNDVTRFVDLAARIDASHTHLHNVYCYGQKFDPQNGLELMAKCHTEIAELLSAHLPQLQEELKKCENQLDDLFALVKGK